MSIEQIWDILTSVVAIASAIAAVTPTPKDDELLGKIYRLAIELPALNIGKAKETGNGRK